MKVWQRCNVFGSRPICLLGCVKCTFSLPTFSHLSLPHSGHFNLLQHTYVTLAQVNTHHTGIFYVLLRPNSPVFSTPTALSLSAFSILSQTFLHQHMHALTCHEFHWVMLGVNDHNSLKLPFPAITHANL